MTCGETVRCQKCGSENPEGRVYCGICGNDLTPGTEWVLPEKRELRPVKDIDSRALLLFLVGILMVCFAVILEGIRLTLTNWQVKTYLGTAMGVWPLFFGVLGIVLVSSGILLNHMVRKLRPAAVTSLIVLQLCAGAIGMLIGLTLIITVTARTDDGIAVYGQRHLGIVLVYALGTMPLTVAWGLRKKSRPAWLLALAVTIVDAAVVLVQPSLSEETALPIAFFMVELLSLIVLFVPSVFRHFGLARALHAIAQQ